MKFIIEDNFWDLFPQAKIGIVICKGIDNTGKLNEELLREGEKYINTHITNSEFSKNDVIKVWRDAFLKFKTKKGARSSIEALLKRVYKGGNLNNINPLVDIYNYISLKYALPCGGEDIDTFVGNLRLTKATGNEEFVSLGSDENSSPNEGEIVYKDDFACVCRCFNWREAQRTMLTEKTSNAFLCIESLDHNRSEEFKCAVNELSELVKRYLGGEISIEYLDINKKEIHF